MKYKDVIWDWNGTLINDATLCADVLDFMMRSRGLGGIRLEEYRENFRFPISDFYKDMGFDLSSSNFEEIGAEFILQYNERRFKCSLHDGAGKCIAKLKSIGVRQSILSASQKDDLATAIKHFGISEYFEETSGLNHIYATSKAALGLEHIKRLGADRKRTLMVGDTEHDAAVANVMGVDCVLIDKGHYSRRRLLSLGFPVVSSHDEILGIVESQEQ